jgi:hypothetical protein
MIIIPVKKPHDKFVSSEVRAILVVILNTIDKQGGGSNWEINCPL